MASGLSCCRSCVLISWSRSLAASALRKRCAAAISTGAARRSRTSDMPPLYRRRWERARPYTNLKQPAGRLERRECTSDGDAIESNTGPPGRRQLPAGLDAAVTYATRLRRFVRRDAVLAALAGDACLVGDLREL